ncbi:MAG: protein-methionine-sulfoxide reductase heme-binding subunit MsrQ [Rhodobacteraceae bacterium]|nr:protein-methionine-sulfoxide reductase heme-binding subunit MsrQ [Paracoccaceae bacterium]
MARISVSQHINDVVRRVPAGLLYILAPLPAIWWFYQGLTGGLGPEPIRSLEHLYGELALQLLIAGLAVTPLRRFAGLNLLKFRRALGLVAFGYVVLHLTVWLVLDMGVWSRIWADIVKRPYITIGMAGLAALLPLAVTSNNLSLRRLGPVRWRGLHRLTYLAVLLGGAHYVMLVKGWQIEPILYLGLILALLAARLLPRRGRVAA